MTPSKYQTAVIDWLNNGTGNALVSARAGSGKTSLLLMLANELPPVARSLFLAFNKSIATELQNRLPKHVEAATFHSVCFRAYGRMRSKRVKVDGNKTTRIYDALFGVDSEDTLRGPVLRLVGLAKSSAMVPDCSVDDWAGLIEHHSIEFDTQSEAIAGIDRARQILARNNEELDSIDFDDMLYLPWLLNAPIGACDYVMIDEAQDTNTVQRELLRRMLGARGRLVAVGDSYQAIYGFRGADSGAMAAISREFNCTELPLSISYRCPASVIDVANDALGLGHPVIEARENAPQGTVSHPGAFNLRQFMADDLIICRNTAPVVGLAYKLISARIPAKVLGRDIGRGLIVLIKKMRASDIDELSERIDAWERRECESAIKAGREMRVQSIADRAESIRASIDALSETERTIPALIRNIESLFSDNGPQVTTLATVHKSKGLESRRVFVLDRALMPSKYARQEWQMEQERNLMYVAYTRSLDTLVFIDSKTVKDGTQDV